MFKNFWSVTIDDADDPYVIYSGPSMTKAVYEAGHLRGLDGRNCYVVYHMDGAPKLYLDEDDMHEVVLGVVAPYFK